MSSVVSWSSTSSPRRERCVQVSALTLHGFSNGCQTLRGDGSSEPFVEDTTSPVAGATLHVFEPSTGLFVQARQRPCRYHSHFVRGPSGFCATVCVFAVARAAAGSPATSCKLPRMQLGNHTFARLQEATLRCCAVRFLGMTRLRTQVALSATLPRCSDEGSTGSHSATARHVRPRQRRQAVSPSDGSDLQGAARAAR
jgi:hypothetical protein